MEGIRCYYYASMRNAPVGQYLTHFPQFVHLSLSTMGALAPICVMAFTGHTITAGHL